MALAPAVRQAVWAVDGQLPVADVRTQQAIVKLRVARPALVLRLLAVAAGIALLLAVVGLYGVIAFLVATRSREIGVRLAVGASPALVVAMIMRQGAGVAITGIALGIAAAMLATRLMSSLLFGIEATDPKTYAVAAAAVAVVALFATTIPAARAAAVDPARTLRAD
jgi:ABC-type antimicrobial peptide transport system permease subunit